MNNLPQELIFTKTKRKLIYWGFQFILWSAYFVFSLYVVHDSSMYRRSEFNWPVVSYLFVLCYSGIIFSSILRFIYIRTKPRIFTLIQLILLVVVSSFILAQIWFLVIFLLDFIEIILKQFCCIFLFYHKNK